MRRTHRLLLAAVAAVALLATGLLVRGPRDTPSATPQTRPVVILMIGDGLGRGPLAAASHYRFGEPGRLFVHTLPHRGKMVTVGIDGITDSAAAATAMATGRFTLNGRVGLDRDGNRLANVVELARDRGLAVGIVTTASLPHATPAAFTAHTDSRASKLQIVDQQVSAGLEVMLGGGAVYFRPRGPRSERTDAGLISPMHRAGYQVVNSRRGLLAAVAEERTHLLGLFGPTDHIPYAVDRSPEIPSLAEMSMAALRTLERSPDGFLLLIEGARIDMAGHHRHLRRMIGEVLDFDDAVREVTRWARMRDDVLLLVTADHDTGGLRVLSSRGRGREPRVSWHSDDHTDELVDVFGLGPGSELFHRQILDHRWIHAATVAHLNRTPLKPPRPLRPDETRIADADSTPEEERERLVLAVRPP